MKPKGLPARKANAYYAYFSVQNPNTAMDKTKALFSDYLGIPIDYAATLDFNGFTEAVDSLGGLTIDVDMDMRYVDHWDGTNINLSKGTQKLNGRQTLDFVRYRKSNNGTEVSDDHERNVRQHQVLEKLVAKLNSAGSIAKLGSLLDIAGRSMKTDLPASRIKSFIFTYMGIHKENIRFIPVNGEWVSPYVVVKKEDLNAAKEALKKQLDSSDSAAASGADWAG